MDYDMTSSPTVQLRHELPDGSWHIDWMLDRDTHSGLITYRLPDRPDSLVKGAFLAAECLGEHRREYLDYEGLVSNNRGSVTRVGRGEILDWASDGDEWWITVVWEAGPRQVLRITKPELDTGSISCRIYCEESFSG